MDSKRTQPPLDADIKPKQQLNYLDGFTENQIVELEKKYKKTRQELDQIVADYYKSFWWERILKYGELSTNFLYMIFRAKTSNAGITNVAQTVKPDAVVSDAVGYGIGASVAIPGSLVYTFSSSAKNDAVLAVLDYANRDPLDKRFSDALAYAREHKVQAFFDSLLFSLNTTILVTTNATFATSEIIPIINQLNTLPPTVKWAVVAGIEFFAYRYNENYYRTEYTKGLKFWWNEENRPYLLGEISRGNFAVPLEIFLQGIVSAVGLRAFPNYYYLAVAAAEALGGFLPAAFVASMAFLHGLCVLYPATFDHYMKADEEINAILRSQIDLEKVKEISQDYIKKFKLDKASEKELNHHLEEIINGMVKANRDALSIKARKGQGSLALFKEEPSSIFTTGVTTAIGASFGYQLSPYIMTGLAFAPPALIATLSASASAGLFGYLYYKAEDKRVNDNEILKLLKPSEEKPSKPANQKAALVAGILNTCNAISSATSTIGSYQLLGNSSGPLRAFVSKAALEAATNTFLISFPKTLETLESLCHSHSEPDVKLYDSKPIMVENHFKAAPPTLFKPATPTTEIEDDWLDMSTEKSAIEMHLPKPA